MKTRRHTLAILVAAALAGTMSAARADDAAALTHEILVMDAAATNGSSNVTNRIAADFQTFSGSRQNATALVTGLREGSEITLVQRGHRSATFTPPTGHMGYGNVSTSLALAKYQLAQQGITNPTPLQLKASLNGGTIFVDGRRFTYDGVLQMRADGLGWGQIAHQLGTKLGPVVSGVKAQNTSIVSTPRTSAPVGAGSTVHTTTTSGQPRAGNAHGGGKGIVNAGGSSTTGTGKSKDDASVSAATGKSPAPGRGIVTAGGQTVGTGAHGGGNGRAAHGAATTAGSGVVTGSGAVTAAGASAGNGGGGGQGHGKALGHSK